MHRGIRDLTQKMTLEFEIARLTFGKLQPVTDSKWLGFTLWPKTVNPKSSGVLQVTP